MLTALQETRAPWEEVEHQLSRMCAEASRRNEAYHERRRRPAPWRGDCDEPAPADPRAPPAAPDREPPPPPPEPAEEPAEDHRRPWRPPPYAAEEASRLQRLYRANREKAVRQVLQQQSPPCPVPGDELAAHFAPPPCPPVQWEQRPEEVPDLTPAAPSPQLTAPFTADEVWERLRRASNTAPGPDGLRYAAWRALDPGALLLTRAFELCRLARRVPQAWLESETVLLHKGGDPTRPESWRPIALGATVAKVYAGVWADRLSRWAETSDLLSPAQKGFRPFDGVLEHNFLLQHTINGAREGGTEAHVAFIDLTNAFGTLPHSYMWEVLGRLGVPAEVVAVIRGLYEGSGTRYRAGDGLTAPVACQRGVRQGCPLSGLLFILSLEPLLRALAGTQVRCLAFADDLALIFSRRADVRDGLSVLERVCAWAGLTPNPAKSALLSVGAPSPQVTLCGAPLTPIPQDAAYRYLGRPVGHTRLCQPPLQVVAEARRDARRLLESPLAPWQKLDAVRVFIAPRLTHCLRLGVLPKGVLDSFDRSLRWRVKGVLGVPISATSRYLYSPTAAGGVGLTHFTQEADIQLVAATQRLLHSRDPVVAELAAAELAGAVRRRVRRDPTPADMAQYLNGATMRDDGGGVSCRTTRTRVATVALRRSAAVSWRPADPPSLQVEEKDVPPRREARALRDATRQAEAAALTNLPQQGKVMACVADQPVSSHYMYNGSFTRFAEWRFVHRARLGLVPLNAYTRRAGADRRCRRCGYPQETLPHVSNHCLAAHAEAYQLRHNAILARLERATPVFPGDSVRVNQRVPGLDSPLRPDLVVTRGDRVLLVDVTVAFENRPEALRAAAAEKETKYAGLVAELRRQGKVASVHALVVGSLGTWHRGNEATLRQLRVSRVYARLMRKLMVSDTLRWSRDIYIEHVTGRRQYDE